MPPKNETPYDNNEMTEDKETDAMQGMWRAIWSTAPKFRFSCAGTLRTYTLLLTEAKLYFVSLLWLIVRNCSSVPTKSQHHAEHRFLTLNSGAESQYPLPTPQCVNALQYIYKHTDVT